MKHFLFTTTFLFCITFVFGQKQVKSSKTEKDSILEKSTINLIGKWKLDSALYRKFTNIKIDKLTAAVSGTNAGLVTNQTRNYTTLEFYKNNKYRIETSLYSQKGKWKYENDKLFFKIKKSKHWGYGYFIEKITTKKLVLKLDGEITASEIDSHGTFEVEYYSRIK